MTRRAIVTGGGTGIGRAVAHRLAADGNTVVIVGRRPETLEFAAEKINAEIGSDQVAVAVADLTDPDQVRALAERLSADGDLDVLVTNAGGAPRTTAEGLEGVTATFLDNFRMNVITAVLPTEALLPYLARPGGRIISVSSIAALRGVGAYAASKAALHGWALGLAHQLAPQGITVNVVAPGYIPDTEFWVDRWNQDAHDRRVAQIPIGRAGIPEDVAAGIAYLAAPDAGWTTGQILQINGGTLFGRG
ncbi:SDR family NAD(P)-dependent oxidoreductase [Nocardia seriolae]|uniref:SDR family NAD(P)-dependent oxidoreductase n=1 Tax=Nocardia seriolae TaxID=37332 RepID=UPI00051A257B|nr:SDR family oxidoreductase [Nocardia seriolae]BEK85445.1 SDR family oxidoreductase [Nocardia seriolae]